MTGEMLAGDAHWAAGLMERQRQAQAGYSPVFWRPAEGAAGLHERFLRRQILSEATAVLRTRHGFIICERRRPEGLVDDFTVAPPGTWGSDGAALLLAAAGMLAARAAQALGAVLAVIPAVPGTAPSEALPKKGWTIASDWYLGWPRQHSRGPAGPR